MDITIPQIPRVVIHKHLSPPALVATTITTSPVASPSQTRSPMQKFFNNSLFSDVVLQIFKTPDMVLTTDENDQRSVEPSIMDVSSIDLEDAPGSPSRKRKRTDPDDQDDTFNIISNSTFIQPKGIVVLN